MRRSLCDNPLVAGLCLVMDRGRASVVGVRSRQPPSAVFAVVALLLTALSACNNPDRRPVTNSEKAELSEQSGFVPLDAFYELAAEYATHYPPPPGGFHRVGLIELQNMDHRTLEFLVAFRSACQWHRYWLDRLAVGDNTAAAEALPVLVSIPSWDIFAELEEFWEPFHRDLEKGATDGPQWFTDVNCLHVRDELLAPSDVSMHDRSYSVILEEETGVVLNSDERRGLTGRLASQFPKSVGVSLTEPDSYLRIRTEKELAAVVARHAWCLWLGTFIDAADDGDLRAAEEAIEGMSRFTTHEALSAVDRFGIEQEVRGMVEAGARERDPLWPVAEYRSNCFGLSALRDQRLQSG